MKHYRTLGVPDFVADKLTQPVYIIDGKCEAACSVLIFKKPTPYRGEVLVGAFPKEGEPYVCGLLELKDVRPVSGLSVESWKQVAQEDAPKQGFAWFFSNPRRVIEMPLKVKRGWASAELPEEEITEYPVELKVGEDYWPRLMGNPK